MNSDNSIPAGLHEDVLFDGDTGTQPPEVRDVLTTLLAERILHGDRKPRVWQALVTNEDVIRSVLHDLYLDLRINYDHQVAFKQQIRPDHEHRILLPARTTSVEFAAGILLLAEESRRAFFTGTYPVKVTRKAFNEAFEVLWGTEVTNKVARTRNGNASIKALCEEGLLIGPKDGEEWEVSPAVEVLYGPSEIDRLAANLSAADLEGGEDEAGDTPRDADLGEEES